MKWHHNIGRTIPIHYHIYFWISYFFINVVRWGSYFNDYTYSLKSNLVEFSIHIILAYFVLYYLLPKYVAKGRYYTFIIIFLLLLVVVYVARTSLNYFFVSQNIWPEAFGEQKAYTFNHIVAVTIGEIYVIALVSGIKITADWLSEKNRVEKLNKEKLKTELQLLKSQIRPHFFFNTLNNLYALTLEKSDMAPELVIKLSEIMEFVIYDSTKQFVPLTEEIKYINNYIEIEKIRFGERINSNVKYIPEEITHIKVPPLLFLPFIENSFKHGLINNPDFKMEIRFENLSNSKLLFSIKNNHNSHLLPKQSKSGLGLKNIKRRLQLIYQNRYNLKIVSLSDQFIIELSIPL